MLTNRHILAAHKLPRQQFPDLEGYSHLCYASRQSLQPLSMSTQAGFIPEGSFHYDGEVTIDLCCVLHATCIYTAVQILFVPEHNHWVTSSYHGKEVRLYVSCFNGRLTPSLEEKLVRIYRLLVDKKQLMVTAVPVQQQTGKIDLTICCSIRVPCGCQR